MPAIDVDKIKSLDRDKIAQLAKAHQSVVKRGGAVFHGARNRAIVLSRIGIDMEILEAYADVSVNAWRTDEAYSAINLAYIATLYPERFTIEESDALTVAWRSVMGEDGFL